MSLYLGGNKLHNSLIVNGATSSIGKPFINSKYRGFYYAR